jgi:hypothetical protein
MSLLEQLYGSDGPVAKTYRAYGIRYQSRPFLARIGNELYVNSEEERRTLFPTQSLEASGQFRHRNLSLSNIFISILNSLALSFISFSNEKPLATKLMSGLRQSFSSQTSIRTALNEFLEEYRIIFEINLLSGIALNRLMTAVAAGRNNLSLSTLLLREPEPGLLNALPQEGLIGNSLDFLDTSEFAPLLRARAPSSNEETSQLKEPPGLHAAYVQKLQDRAARLSQLREVGRWLTVRHIHRLRHLLLQEAQKSDLKCSEDIFSFTFAEICSNSLSQTLADSRRDQQASFANYAFPDQVGTCLLPKGSPEYLGISPGEAEGILLSPQDLELGGVPQSMPIILLVPCANSQSCTIFSRHCWHCGE